jgi:hypothetical protein
MSKIVVSYRRSDSQAIAGRIADRLIGQFGEDSVFMDVDNIPFGIDFRQHIHSVLSRAEVLIAVVGPEWLGVGADGSSRIQAEDDPVRVEIETAMQQNILVIPVLIGGAGMPKAASLPDSLKNFSFLNAAPIDAGRDFRPHVDRLIQSIGEVLARKGGPTRAPLKQSTAAAPATATRTNARALLVGLGMVLLLAGGAATWQLKLLDTPAMPASSGGNAAPQSADDIQWDKLKDTKNTGDLRRFIQQNPSSKHRVAAEQLLLGLLTQSGSNASDDEDWTHAQSTDTFDAYQAYLKSYPQGRHVEAARQAAAEVHPVANAVKEEPAIGLLLPGDTAIVDDRDPMCKRTEVKIVTGGNVTTVPKIIRSKKCVPRDQFP